MEVTIVEKPSSERREANLIFLSCPSPRELRYMAANEKQEGDTCKHFTIRGYVAGIRNRDAKICWPFLASDHLKSDEYANLLPPIPEAKFLRWDCGNCIDRTAELAALKENKALFNSHSDEASTSLHGKASAEQEIRVHDLKELSEDKLIHGELAEGDIFIDFDNCPSISLAEYLSSEVTAEGYQISNRNDSHAEPWDLSSDKPVSVLNSAEQEIMVHDVKELSEDKLIHGESAEDDVFIDFDNCPSISLAEYLSSGVTAEGYQIPNRNDSHEKPRDLLSDKPVSVVTEGPVCKTVKRDKCTVMQTTDTFGTAHGEDAPHDKLQDKSKETELVHEIVDPKMGPVPTVMGINVSSSAEMHNDVNGVACGVDFTGLDENSHETSGSEVGLTEYTVQRQNHDQRVSTSDRKVQHKKSRKVRFLEDIMKSEQSDMKSKNSPISNCDAEFRQTADDINKRRGLSEGKEEHLIHVSHLSVQETKIEPIKNKEQYSAHEDGDEGPSLMCWLKKVAKNALTHKRGAELKHNDSVAANSKSAADASARREINLTHKGSAGNRGNKSKSFVHRKQDQIPWVYLKPQQETIATKGLVAAEDVAKSNYHATTNCVDLRGKGISRKSWHQDSKVQDSSYVKDIMSKKKRKALQVEGEEYPQMHLSKDTFEKHDLANINYCQGEKKVAKKRRTARVRHNGALDDIPMDIVELLAKNRQERLSMDANASSDATHDLSEKNQNIDTISNTTSCNRDMVLDTAWKNLSQKRALSSGVLIDLKSNTEADGRLNADSFSTAKQSHYMESNQQDPVIASRGLLALPQSSGQPMCYTHPSKFDPQSNCIAQRYRSKMRMLTPESYLGDKAISGQNSYGNSHVWPPFLSTSTSFRVYSPCTTNNKYMNVLHHDSLPQRKVETASHMTADLTLVSPDGSRLLNGKEAEPLAGMRIFPAVTLADNVNRLYQDGTILLNEKEHNESSIDKRDPQDFSYAKERNVFYPNEIIPATHLLRLMDPATRSSSSIHNPLDINDKGFIQLSDFCGNQQARELVHLDELSKNSWAIKHPLMVKEYDQDQQQESSCKPVRPLPRFGVLGTLLQEEIAACSNRYGAQLGFRIGPSNESVTCEANRMRKSVCSTSNIASTSGVMTKVSISRHENNTWTSGFVNVIPHPDSSWVRNDVIQVNQKAEAAVQPLKSISRREICTVNRNPADFSIVDEDNEYMIWNEGLRHRHPTPLENKRSQNHTERKKRRKVMKLTAPIGLARS